MTSTMPFIGESHRVAVGDYIIGPSSWDVAADLIAEHLAMKEHELCEMVRRRYANYRVSRIVETRRWHRGYLQLKHLSSGEVLTVYRESPGCSHWYEAAEFVAWVRDFLARCKPASKAA